MYKHYIRTNASGIVMYGFSTAFEEPKPGDYLYNPEADRHFTLYLYNERGQYKWKVVNNAIVERTQEELNEEWENRPPGPPSQEERIGMVEQMILDLMMGGM